MARGGGFSDEDLRAWAAVGRTVRPLPGKLAIAQPAGPAEAPGAAGGLGGLPTAGAGIGAGAGPGTGIGIGIGIAPAGLDRVSWRKFRSGQIRPAHRLDLHGLTAARAHRATIGFVQQAHAEGQRCVEIITGKGAVLARELPLWLEAPPLHQLILALAYPSAANAGALRILLRRRR